MERNGSHVYAFEKEWPEADFTRWMKANWLSHSVVYSAAYVTAIFAVQRYMEGRPRFSLTRSLAAWNALLAAFSIVGTVRCWPEVRHLIANYGLYHSVCAIRYMKNEVIAFWAAAFVLSKVAEFGDTAFIVLRKQPLTLLHWYHHVTVMVYVWFSYVEATAPGLWFAFVNYAVHAVMYTYYAFRSLKYRPPQWLKMLVTVLQLTQMVFGCALNIYVFYLKSGGHPCDQSAENLYYSSAMYLSYFVLFSKFFYETYMAPTSDSAKKLE